MIGNIGESIWWASVALGIREHGDEGNKGDRYIVIAEGRWWYITGNATKCCRVYDGMMEIVEGEGLSSG